MARRGGFQAPINSVDYAVANEHARKGVCRACGTPSSAIRRGRCWRCRPLDPDEAPPLLAAPRPTAAERADG